MRGNPSPGAPLNANPPGGDTTTPDDARLASQIRTPNRSRYESKLRRGSKLLPTLLAVSYAIAAYTVGFLLLGSSIPGFVFGTVLLAHSMVIAAFLLHECVHGSLFVGTPATQTDPHSQLAAVMSWIAGCCYSDFERLRDKHLRHHFERADIVSIDYRQMLLSHPWLRKLVETGQWLYLPAVEILFHALAIIFPLARGTSSQRRRVLKILALRIVFFSVLTGWLGWAVVPGYCIAYMLFLTVMGLMDAFQHQYLLLTGLQMARDKSPTQDRERFPSGYFSREYEQQRTFSNLISRRWPRLNWLVLNFCYHNAHHHRPMEPWYALPMWHRELKTQSANPPLEIPLPEQLRMFFQFRVERVMAPATDSLEESRAPGAAGVSFLTPL